MKIFVCGLAAWNLLAIWLLDRSDNRSLDSGAFIGAMVALILAAIADIGFVAFLFMRWLVRG